MRTIFIFFFSVGIISCGKETQDSPSEKRQEAITQNEYLELLNKHRQKIGVAPLTYSYFIETEALEHSSKMAKREVAFGHNGWRDRCRRIVDHLRGNACSEIVATGQKNPAAVFEAWFNSSSHRSSLENPRYTHTGLGLVEDKNGALYWTQLFLEVK